MRHGIEAARSAGRRKTEQGWTFVETLIVIAIVLILTGTVGFVAFRYVDNAREVAARSQIGIFTLALHAYLFDNGSYPSQEQGLDALWRKPTTAPEPKNWKGPYVERKVPFDPWGHRYQYRLPGPSELPFGVCSFGSDGAEGGEGNAKDISSWEW